jgi:hypothetical protein
MEISSADFMKLTINQVSDLLLSEIDEDNKKVSGAVLHGADDDGRLYSLRVELIIDE